MSETHLPIFNNNKLFFSIISYLPCKDIQHLSKVNKHFNSFVDKFTDNIWKNTCYSYFSSYVQHDISNSEINIYQAHKKDNFNWKKCFATGISIKNYWDEYIKKNPSSKTSLSLLKNDLYKNLKKCLVNRSSSQKKEILPFENKINTSFQFYLYDYINNEKDSEQAINAYLKILKNKKKENIQNNTNNTDKDLSSPFFSLINNALYLIRNVQLNKKNFKTFNDLRWYSYNTINTLNFIGDNMLLFTLKNIIMTLRHFCEMSYQYLISFHENNLNEQFDFLVLYHQNYTNYVNCAIYINDKYKNINYIINKIYDKINNQHNSKASPQFSLLRLFMLIWNIEITNKISNSIIHTITSFFQDITEAHLTTLTSQFTSKNNQCDNSFISCNSFDYLSTNYNSFLSSNSMNVCKRDHNGNILQKKELMALLYSSLIDSCCDEINVYSLNHSEIDTNEIYNKLEKALCGVIKEKVECFYDFYYLNESKSNIINTHRTICEVILNSFSGSVYLESKFISKTRLALFNVLQLTLKEIIHKEISHKFINEFILGNISNLQNPSEQPEHNDNIIDNDIQQTLLHSIQNLSIDNNIKHEYINIFINNYRKSSNNLLLLDNFITNWYINQECQMMVKNNKLMKDLTVIKFLDVKRIFNSKLRTVMSFNLFPTNNNENILL
jgi:hypothetical protein